MTTTTLDVLQTNDFTENTATIEIYVHGGPTLNNASISPAIGGTELLTDFAIDVDCSGYYQPFMYEYYWRYSDSSDNENTVLFDKTGASSIEDLVLPAGDLISTVICTNLYGVSDSMEIDVTVNELISVFNSSVDNNETSSLISSIDVINDDIDLCEKDTTV